ncbi:hypothetical protein [Bradyrhizobium sp. JYMT SZCCT0180]|uniref:hypothetical protein n=1 Tax=Bradyrhizobium sp. JYMT SZCCT0180 TaxID=2807666 RepID=UPI001BA49923|nr:hypothetical protein [Bradyrhizobium sp. JYMT SZCCT0180]MBR1211900.1 hypothetical protein [Bradyrhizobium sp. JYMT SZCCT0180]
MEPAPADISRIVEYSRDRWAMARMPLALLFCLTGLAFVVYVEPRPPGAGVPTVFGLLMAAAAVVALAIYAFERMFEGRTMATRLLAAALVVLAVMVLVWNVPADFFHPGLWTKLPTNLFGWMLIAGGIGWITHALYRHLRPARPVLMLSPAGIAFHATWLRDLFIPWHEVRGVEALETMPASGIPYRYQDLTVVVISQEFYEAHILPKRGFMMGPGRELAEWLVDRYHHGGWDQVFWPKESPKESPKGSSMQMVLHHELFSIPPKQVREPVEARWKAFRNERPSSLPVARPIPGSREIYGAWSIDGSLWQAITFLVPLIGIIAILVDSTG